MIRRRAVIASRVDQRVGRRLADADREANRFIPGYSEQTSAGPADAGRARRQAAADLQLKGRSRKFYSLPTEHESKGRFTQRSSINEFPTSPLRNKISNRSVLLAAAQASPLVKLSQGSSPARCEACRFAVVPVMDADERNGAEVMQRSERDRARLAGLCAVLAVTGVVVSVNIARAEQPPAPCPNPTAAAD